MPPNISEEACNKSILPSFDLSMLGIEESSLRVFFVVF